MVLVSIKSNKLSELEKAKNISKRIKNPYLIQTDHLTAAKEVDLKSYIVHDK